MSSKTAQACQRIKRLIEGGHLARGERLTESRAAELVGMSRGTVRESLLLLEAEGWLQNQGLRRSRVVAYAEDQDPQELLHRYELRERIEGAAAALAAKNMTGWQIDELRKFARAANEAVDPDDREARYAATRELHHFLLANCGNPLLLEVWQTYRLAPPQPRSRELEDRILAIVARHNPEATTFAAVVDAIAAHDPDQAETLMRQRIRAVTEALREIIMEQGEGGRPGRLSHIKNGQTD